MALCDICKGEAPDAHLSTCPDPACAVTEKEKAEGWEPMKLCAACLEAHKEDAHKPNEVVKAEAKALKLSEAAAKAQAEAEAAAKKAAETKATAEAKAKAGK